jgi:Holliday junction resolvasome RuvABC endonuclease subunit
MTVYVGLDLSLRSPGIAVLDTRALSLRTYFFAVRKRERRFRRAVACRIEADWLQFLTGERAADLSFEVEALEGDLDDMPSLARYGHIGRHVAQLCRGDDVRVRFEGHAFDCRTPATTKLHELGGVVRHILFEAGVPMDDVAPACVKKCFTQNGRATKADMHAQFRACGLPDLLAMFALEARKDSVPTPVQDVVDAVAILSTFGRLP